MSQFLPQGPGWLPTWQLFLAATSIFNTVQNFVTLNLTQRIYGNQPNEGTHAGTCRTLTDHHPTVTPLHARTFAVWTLTAAVVRGYAAYHIEEKMLAPCHLLNCDFHLVYRVYDMALFTYLIAFGHFSSEILIFRTAKLPGPVLNPVIVASKLLTRL
jgi:hypothetical protein